MRKPGFKPLCSKTQARSEVVVVLPCVPVDHNRPFAAYEKFLEQFGQRAVTQFVVQHGFHFGIAARQRVAHHHQVRLARQIGFGVAGHDLDLFGGQEGGHGRIHIVIRAGDGEALVAQGGRDRGHGRAADAGEMDRFDFRKHRP